MFTPKSAIKLRTWTERGKENIKQIIAKLGIPLEDSKEGFEQLSPLYKENLKEKMLDLEGSPVFYELLISSFSYSIDSRNTFFSNDFHAILDSVLNSSKDFNEHVLGLDLQDKSTEKTKEPLLNNFWVIMHKLLDRLFKKRPHLYS